MNNINNCLEIDKIKSQLEKADIKKSRLIRNIHKEYELYLNLVRDLLHLSVKKGINELCSALSTKNIFLNADELFCFYEKKISKLIHSKLPLITIEQLKINKIEKNLNQEINFNILGKSLITKDKQKEKFQYEDGFEFEDTLKFEISEDVFNPSEYYQTKNNDICLSLDLDNNDHINFLSKNHNNENIGIEKQFISSILELIEEVKVEKPRKIEKHNINEMDIYLKHQNLKNFDLIDKSLENLLLDLSYKINQELFKANLINKIISQDSFEFLVGKKLMIKHIHPFVINFDFNMNQSSLYGENLPNIVFINISTVELEFENLNLTIQRNKLNELKSQFQHLIKKERYWRQKQISLNKIS